MEGDETTVQAAGPLRIVPDDTVKIFPYQSVGKLFFVSVNSTSGATKDCRTSAWVATGETASQLHVIVTAAHCLKLGRKTYFSCLDSSLQSRNRYPQIPGGEGEAWAVDPNWDPNNTKADHDIGIIKFDKDPKTEKYVDDVVKPIQVL